MEQFKIIEVKESIFADNNAEADKVRAMLKKQGIIDSHRGVGGFTLLVEPEELTLYRVYQAINGADEVHVFDLHQNPNDACVVGRHIRPVLTDVFRGIEEKAERALKATTLADCMAMMRERI